MGNAAEFFQSEHLSRVVSLVLLAAFLTASGVSQAENETFNLTDQEPTPEIKYSVLFYEGNTQDDLYGTESEKDYSITENYYGLANALQEGDITVNRLNAELKREILNRYKPSTVALANPTGISDQEMGLLASWVVRDGGSLWVCSEKAEMESSRDSTPAIDTLTTYFNLDITEHLLRDDDNYIGNSLVNDTNESEYNASNFSQNNFLVSGNNNILNDSEVKPITREVDELGFYGASGIDHSGAKNVWTAVEAGTTTYSGDHPKYLPGTKPPLYVVAELGQGQAVFSSDCDIYSDENIGKYDNGKLALNTFKWLINTGKNVDSGGDDILFEVEALERENQAIAEERNRLDRKTDRLISTRQNLQETLEEKQQEDEGGFNPLYIVDLLLLAILGGATYSFRDKLVSRIPRFNQEGEIEESLDENARELGKQLGLESKANKLEKELDLDE